MDSGLRAITFRFKRMTLWTFIFALGAFPFLNTAGFAQEKKNNRKEYRFEGSEIEGKREKPKDLYILPWQSSQKLEATDLQMDFLKDHQNGKDRYQLQKDYQYSQKTGVTKISE